MIEPMASLPGWWALASASLLGRRLRSTSSTTAPILALALASGVLAGLAFGIKQPAGIFLAAIALPHLDAGRIRGRALAAQVVGLLAPPALFFVSEPAALAAYWELSVVGLSLYAQGDLVPADPWPDRLQTLRWVALVPGLLLVGLVTGFVRAVGAGRGTL